MPEEKPIPTLEDEVANTLFHGLIDEVGIDITLAIFKGEYPQPMTEVLDKVARDNGLTPQDWVDKFIYIGNRLNEYYEWGFPPLPEQLRAFIAMLFLR